MYWAASEVTSTAIRTERTAAPCESSRCVCREMWIRWNGTQSQILDRTANGEVVEALPIVTGQTERAVQLKMHGATCVVDVGTVPRSRHNPQFNKDSLPSSLKNAGLCYIHLPGLGGLRHAKRNTRL